MDAWTDDEHRSAWENRPIWHPSYDEADLAELQRMSYPGRGATPRGGYTRRRRPRAPLRGRNYWQSL